MGRKKLTLSAEEDVIRASRQLAKRSRASISEMFSRWVLSVSDASRGDAETEAEPIGPLTRKALGLASLLQAKSDRERREEALAEREEAGR